MAELKSWAEPGQVGPTCVVRTWDLYSVIRGRHKRIEVTGSNIVWLKNKLLQPLCLCTTGWRERVELGSPVGCCHILTRDAKVGAWR